MATGKISKTGSQTFDLSLKRPLTDWPARHLRRAIVLNLKTAHQLDGIDPAHVQAVIDGTETPNTALMEALYPDPEDLDNELEREPSEWPDRTEFTDEETISTSIAIRDALALFAVDKDATGPFSALSHQVENLSYHLNDHLSYALMEQGAIENTHDVSHDHFALVFLAGVLWGQRYDKSFQTDSGTDSLQID